MTCNEVKRGDIVSEVGCLYGPRSASNNVLSGGERVDWNHGTEVTGAWRRGAVIWCHHVPRCSGTEAQKRPSSPVCDDDVGRVGPATRTGCQRAAERRQPVSKFLRSTTSSPLDVISPISVSRPTNSCHVDATYTL